MPSEEVTLLIQRSNNIWLWLPLSRCRAWIRWWCSRWPLREVLHRHSHLNSSTSWKVARNNSNITGRNSQLLLECQLRVSQTQVWKGNSQVVQSCKIISKWVVHTFRFPVTSWIEVWAQATWCSQTRTEQLRHHSEEKETRITVFTLEIFQRRHMTWIFTNFSRAAITKCRVPKWCLIKNQTSNSDLDTLISSKRLRPRDAWLKWTIRQLTESKLC